MLQNQTAIIIGSTGLIGKELVEILINDDSFSKVKLFVRRSTQNMHPKIQEFILDFDELASFKNEIKGDVLFSCMGTTIKQAGSKDAQYLVDFTYQYEMAKFASENGVLSYSLVSSAGADSKSKMFYSKIKGELEDEIRKLPFQQIRIFQPSLLLGQRNTSRIGEKFGEIVLSVFGKIPPFAKYRGIKGEIVAQAMVNMFKNPSQSRIKVYKLDEIFGIVD